jgi:pyruvate/2-oxoglutarate dehydrogenase complex dihydrolipoamide acyltransferase (E2) component
MPLFRRFDGDRVRDVSPTRAIMPYIMPQRQQAIVYFEQELDVTRVIEALARKQAQGGPKLTVFHAYVHAAVRTLHERPRLNRFTAGVHLYQRKTIEIAFSAKKSMSDDAPMRVVKRTFHPGASFEQHLEDLAGGVREGRSDQLSASDKEMRLFLRLPPIAVKSFVSLAGWLDARNMLPKAIIGHDPLYASLFVANLGSVGLDAVYHHLYEWGNCPIFAAIGRVREESRGGSTRKVCTVRYTFDERIEDGLYCARALEHLKSIIETWGDEQTATVSSNGARAAAP